ncbi:MAG: hypothetical protein AAFQ43_10720, partial [Bacteroidota bacterium]
AEPLAPEARSASDDVAAEPSPDLSPLADVSDPDSAAPDSSELDGGASRSLEASGSDAPSATHALASVGRSTGAP